MESIDFNPWDLSEEVTRLMADGAVKKGLELFCHVADDVPHALRGAPSRLRQVLTNLIGNAIKFTDRGEIVVEVTRGEMPAEEGAATTLLRFSVTDTGIGISPSMQERLFNAFTQVDASPTRRYGGTGLGLAISKELVERMGGEIGVRSTLGEGAEFWFTVKLDPPQVPVSAAAPVAAGLRGRRVLVVVEHPAGRRVLEQHLRLSGASVQCVDHGRDGLDALRQARRSGRGFALAIVDANLPDMDAREFGRAVQADPEIAAVRLALLVPPNPRGEAAGMREAGFLAQIAMPIRQADLSEKIAGIVDASAASAEPQPSAGSAAALSGVRVLLAEDDPLNQEVTRTMLDSLGCSVCIVDNGARALAALAASDYDIVLMDRQMPEMDGFDATAKIRARGLLRPRQPAGAAAQVRLPVVGLTASAIKGERENFLAAGMDDYLTKPLDPRRLCALVEQMAPEGAPEVEKAGASRGLPPRVLARVGGDRQLLAEISRLFVDDAPRHLAGIRRAIDAHDGESLRRAAHGLKGSAANFDAEELVNAARALEEIGRTSEFEDQEAAWRALTRETDRLISILRSVTV
jgi:CheY-like chemotaxis protein/HPt (histidine-containing phosphotransfer) domain-containing protein